MSEIQEMAPKTKGKIRKDDEINDWIIENEIQQYTSYLFSDLVVWEYEKQIEKWRGYINRVVDAEKMALEKHQNAITEILNNQRQVESESAMLALMVFTLLTGPALSWISGRIQYNLFPKYASSFNHKGSSGYIVIDGRKTAHKVQLSINESEYNKVVAKVFGDAAANFGQTGIGLFLTGADGKLESRKEGKSLTYLNNISNISEKANINDVHASLRTNLEDAIKSEKSKTIDSIKGLALKIKRHPDFGKNLLNTLRHTQPRLRGMQGRQLQLEVQRHIEKMLDERRNIWASGGEGAEAWLYYGNDPPGTSIMEMSDKIEREMWAMWILDQAYKQKVDEIRDIRDDVTVSRSSRVEGRDKIPFGEPILRRLIALGVVFPQMTFQKVAWAMKNPGKSNGNLPNTFVEGNVDTQKEIEAIESWAKNHPMELLSGMFDRIPRKIGRVIDIIPSDEQ